ncbi:Uncharacterised protein [Vibrio cholerae]|nr:Uncharacterised protein [Vibrio cholerae]CSB36663.1 Uncharacterised protein [Vibrio cholerae]CSC08038.1 Uncharacterised protein [Vibrio cholerae]CSC27800.1 Uncharacterised protein [Vibrio cholerae]CSC77632.1 Uncharacterised protein [Vibrio cholerae]
MVVWALLNHDGKLFSIAANQHVHFITAWHFLIQRRIRKLTLVSAFIKKNLDIFHYVFLQLGQIRLDFWVLTVIKLQFFNKVGNHI